MSTPSIQAQISALEDRVASLERAQSQPGEQIQPNYLTVSPSGVITANFSGVVTGSLILPEAASGPTLSTGDAIQWNDGLAVTREFMQGYAGAGSSHTLVITSVADGGPSLTGDFAALQLISQALGAAGSASVQVGVLSTGSGASAFQTIWDSNYFTGNSSWLFNGASSANFPARAFNTAYQAVTGPLNRSTFVTVCVYLQTNNPGVSTQILVRTASTSGGAATGSVVGQGYFITSSTAVAGSATMANISFLLRPNWWYYIQNFADPVSANAIEEVYEQPL